MTGEKQYDVIIVGGGNAALTAALASANEGAKTLMVEKAPEYLRGGNSYFTGGLFRFAYEGLEDILGVLGEMSEEEQAGIDVGSYNQAAFYSDIMRVTEGLSDPQLIQTLVGQSYPTMKWMKDEGVPWILAYGRQAFRHEGILRFWGGLIVEAVGAGKGLSDSLFEIAEKRGVDVRYETKATTLRTDNQGRIVGLTVKDSSGFQDLDSDSVILACGGFEANPGAGLGAGKGSRHSVQHRRRHPDGPGHRSAVLRPLERLSRRRLGPQRPAHRRPKRRRPVPEAFLPLRLDRERRGQPVRR